MILSVVICTRNRADMLKLALESLDRQTISREEFEVLVVDNGSTDDTVEVVSQWLLSGGVHYFYEETPGLSRARNRGWSEAQGKWVAYLDDDAVAAPRWISGFFSSIELFGPKISCMGGPIGLVWPTSVPEWLPSSQRGFLGELDWGSLPRVLSDDEWIGGGNSIYKREVLQTLGGFPDALGRKGENLLSCEEIYLRKKIHTSGFLCAYSPQSLIWHYVHPDRLTKKWFLERSYWQGVSLAKMDSLLDPGRNFAIVSRSVFTFLSLVRYSVVFLLGCLGNQQARFSKLCRIYTIFGRLHGFWF